jgi:hypothetical protein
MATNTTLNLQASEYYLIIFQERFQNEDTDEWDKPLPQQYRKRSNLENALFVFFSDF